MYMSSNSIVEAQFFCHELDIEKNACLKYIHILSTFVVHLEVYKFNYSI